MIIGSAIMIENAVYWSIQPARHSDVFNTHFKESNRLEMLTKDKVMGFITEEYEFLDRKDAADYAFTNGQISTKVSILMSEDIW